VKSVTKTVRVSLGDRSYPIFVGNGVLDDVDRFISARYDKVAIVTQREIPWQLKLSVEHEVFIVPNGESAKSLSMVETLCSQLARFGLKRNHLVIAMGGGVVSDLGGFVAATYYRGTDYINVSTTLLAMVDASIGGKTAVNLREGKNLVGAFWQPKGVFCDLDTLETLPDREYRSGLGEMAKYSFITDEDLVGLSLLEQVSRCAEIKAEVVSEDEREGGRRALLNYGHTLGHAIEAQSFHRPKDERLTHGEAVAIGVEFAARLAYVAGRIGESSLERHRAVLDSYGLSYKMPEWIDIDKALEFMARDKKSQGSLTFVLDGPNGLEVVRDVPESLVWEVLSER
jgi:5-deoxy-5-amino-3-dehydroquinate synthase